MAAVNLDQRSLFALPDRYRPGATAPVLVANDLRTETKVVHMHWGLRPSPGGRPWHNVRAEGKAFAEGRCLVPADDYLINTKEGPHKGRWLVTWPEHADLCFAGIWRPATADWPMSYAIITCAAGPDLSPYEARQSVFLPPEVWRDWLMGAPAEDFLRPLPTGILKVRSLRR